MSHGEDRLNVLPILEDDEKLVDDLYVFLGKTHATVSNPYSRIRLQAPRQANLPGRGNCSDESDGAGSQSSCRGLPPSAATTTTTTSARAGVTATELAPSEVLLCQAAKKHERCSRLARMSPTMLGCLACAEHRFHHHQ